jgi:multidrug efflux system membrane fusion protein
MADSQGSERKSRYGWLLTGIVCTVSLLVTYVAAHRAVVNPRTDDAEVLANFIGIAPQVDGPIKHLAVRDNQFVHTGDLLFEIDERPYEYALERAISEQAALEGEIEDRRRSIAAQQSAVTVAAANVASSASNRNTSASTINEAQAEVNDSKAAVLRAEADRQYAGANLKRLEALLPEQFVTVDQVDQARTLYEMRSRAVDQARAQVSLSEARVNSNSSRFEQAGAEVAQRRAQEQQATNAIQTLDPLTKQRLDRAAAVRNARYNLNNCRVYSPFDARVTNLTISEGAYAHVGTQVFTLIDARVWWVVANFRETQLRNVIPGAATDIFLMSRENIPLRGTVESIGYGVTPDPSVAGILGPGLPNVERSLSWVHLAARYPVRIRIDNPPSDILRIGETAVAVIHPAMPAESQGRR